MRYIDIHSHILPGIDDGSKNEEMTAAMLKQAYEQGVGAMFATSHVLPSGTFDRERYMKAFERTQKLAGEVDPSFKLYTGSEIYYWEGSLQALKDGYGLTLADSRYVLIEFGLSISYNEMYAGMRDYIQDGYFPVIAHVERYECLWKKYGLIDELTDLGCYFQMNVDSLRGGFLNEIAKGCRKLIQKDYIHFLGTDCHDDRIRKPEAERIIKECRGKIEDGTFEELFCGNARRIIENDQI